MASEENPKLKIPFEHGWRRELVQRAGAAEDGAQATGIRADAYYFSPQGKKLRSMKQMELYLKESKSPLELACFSFSRHLLGVGLPLERLRKARPLGAAASAPTAAIAAKKPTSVTAIAGKKAAAAKKIQRQKHTIAVGGASSVIQLPPPGATSPQKLPRKHSLMEKSRKAFAFKAMELKKKMPVFQSEAAKPKPADSAVKARRGRPPGSGVKRGRVPLKRPWLLTEVDELGEVYMRRPPSPTVTGEYFRLMRTTSAPHTADNVLIGRRRPVAPCSLFCFAEHHLWQMALPSAQCLICRCLSHPACVGLDDGRVTSFVCVDCYTGVGLGRGFDGLGDSADSGSESESDSGGDSAEEMLAGPLPPPLAQPGLPPPLLLSGPRFGVPAPLTPGLKRPRGRPRLLGPRQPRPMALRGAYAPRRPRGMGGGRGSRGPRGGRGAPFVTPGWRPSAPGDTPPGGTAATESTPQPAAIPATVPGASAAVPASPAVAPAAATSPASTSPVAVPSPTTSTSPAAASAKKRSWKDP